MRWVRSCGGREAPPCERHLLASEKDGKFSKTVQTTGQSPERFYVVRRTALCLLTPLTRLTPKNEAVKNPAAEKPVSMFGVRGVRGVRGVPNPFKESE